MADVNKDTYQSFLQSVLDKVPEDRRATVQATFGDEAVAATLRDAVLARADYSRQTQAFQQEVAEARAQIGEWQRWYDQEVQAAATRRAEVDQYKELYGELDDEVMDQDKPKELDVDIKELDNRYATAEFINQRDQMAMRFADILTDLKIDHKDRFGSRLDAAQLMDLAQRSGVTIQEAYRQLTEPLEQTRRENELKVAIERAREEGRQQALTDHKLPIGPPTREPSYLNPDTPRVTSARDRVANAVAAFNAGIASR